MPPSISPANLQTQYGPLQVYTPPAMFTMLFSILASLLPARYRGRIFHSSDLDVQRGALLSGIIEMVVPAFVLWLRYPAWYRAYVEAIVQQVIDKGGDKDQQAAAALGAGTFSIFTYLVTPLSVILIYCMFEGVVRLTAFVASKEILPSLPLWVVELLHFSLDTYRKESSYGPRVVDIVRPGPLGEMLIIESCRPKAWDTLLTISYMDKMYELESTAEQAPPRRFVYRLRIIPQSKLIRGIHGYDPRETVDSEL
jgi:hypothetical protein